MDAETRPPMVVCTNCGPSPRTLTKAAFTLFAVNGDPADPLQGFSQVLVRKCADVLGGDGIDEVIGEPLAFQRLLHAAADAGDDDYFDLLLRGDLLLRVGAALLGACRGADDGSAEGHDSGGEGVGKSPKPRWSLDPRSVPVVDVYGLSPSR